MEASVYQVLLVEDPHAEDRLIQRLLSEPQEKLFQFCRVSTYEQAIQLVRFEPWDVILVNRSIGSHPGLEFIHHARLWNQRVPLLLLSERYDYQLEYKARKVGATDYLAKESLTPSVLNSILEHNQNRQFGNQSKASFSPLTKFFAVFEGYLHV